MLTVWGRRSSANVQATMWCIAELDLPVTRIDAGHTYGVVDTPDYLAMNPNGLVPVLLDQGCEPLWETGAILRYLAARYGHDPFWPRDLAERAQVDKWAEWAKVTVSARLLGPVFWRLIRTAPRDQDPAAIAGAMADLSKVLDIAEARLARQPYLAGEAFTLADVQFGHLLFRYFDIPVARPEHPAIRRYYDRLVTRPTFRQHVMVSYDELRVS